MPILSANLSVRNNALAVADYLGNRVAVFDRAGHLRGRLGTKGSGLGEFQLPTGIAQDETGRIYVNDRGNSRIQVLDPFLRPVATIRTPGQNDQLLLTGKSPEVRLLVLGAAPCTQGVCLIREYDADGRLIRIFANLEEFHDKSPLDYSWRAALDERGVLYIANVLDDSLIVFSPGGSFQRRMELASPSMRLFRRQGLKEPKTRTELSTLLLRLKREKFTKIRSLAALDGHIFVQLQRENAAVGEARYILDVYDDDGRLIYYGIPTPGVLGTDGNEIHFVDDDESSDHGLFRVFGCRPILSGGVHDGQAS